MREAPAGRGGGARPTRRGPARPWFAERFGQDVLAMFGTELAPWLQAGVVLTDDVSLHLSDEGLAQADSVAADLF